MDDDEGKRNEKRDENPPPVRDGEDETVGADEDRAEKGLGVLVSVLVES